MVLLVLVPLSVVVSVVVMVVDVGNGRVGGVAVIVADRGVGGLVDGVVVFFVVVVVGVFVNVAFVVILAAFVSNLVVVVVVMIDVAVCFNVVSYIDDAVAVVVGDVMLVLWLLVLF